MSTAGGAPHRTNYARRDLQAAFNWLVSQPESIRKQATDPDRLMALYYRSEQLFQSSESTSGAASYQSPMNHQPMAAVAAPVQEEPPVFQTRPEFKATQPEPKFGFLSDLKQMSEQMRPSEPELELAPPASAHVYPQHQHVQVSSQTRTEVTMRTELSQGQLTQRTHEMARQIQTLFNLSTETEAINFLVALGFEHAKRILRIEDPK